MKTAIITQSRGVFSMTCRVALDIHAPAARIWSLLTDANGLPTLEFDSYQSRGADPRGRATPIARSRNGPHIQSQEYPA